VKKLIALALISVVLITFCAAVIKFEYYPMNIKVQSLLKKPTPDSEPAFVFPIDVTLTGISKDKKWFRFKVKYDLVFFGKYEFEGWTHVDPWNEFENGTTPEVMTIQ
jgi:hypothetical protein